ncbi:MAG: thiamine pyrophosphate-binding protein [Dehalococcoidales bacterium]|nr:thiamine pyrophosphate-binding protein [Dehalococcoidales bacterium]
MSSDKSQARYGSDIMADMLRLLDIDYAAMLPGSTFRGLHDSVVNYLGNNKPEMILCAHEGIAIDVAAGYAMVTGKPMAAMVHNVVGLLNAANDIYNAWLAKVPMLVIGGTGPMDIEKRRSGIDWIHTALVQGNVVRDYVKWDDQPSSIAGVIDSFIRAYQIATTDPQGPVYICLDAGLQEGLLNDEIELPSMKRYPNPLSPQADGATIERVARLLVEAANPVVITDRLAGRPGVVASLAALAELLALPVIVRGGNFPNIHPLNLCGAEEELLKEADVVLALDVNDLNPILTSVAYDTRQSTSIIPEGCQVVHFTPQHLATRSWSHAYGKLVAVDLPITADIALALPLLTTACSGLLTEKRHAELRKRFDNLKARHEALRKQWQTMAENERNKSPIAIPWLAKQVWEEIKGENFALVGNFRGWSDRLWDSEKPYPTIGGIGLGSGPGVSLGAALAYQPEGRLCIDFQPDGDFLFTPAALWTAAHHQIPLLVIMNNNRTYYNSERHQGIVAETRGRPVENRGIGTRIEGPPVDYAALARSFGLHGVGPIDKPDDLRPALAEAIRVVKDKKQLALVDVVTEPSR